MNNVFLKIAGVAGESRDAAHEGWIDAVTYTWGSRRDDIGSGPGKTSFTNSKISGQRLQILKNRAGCCA
ncbi:hypothetical protein PMPD1_2148 [Paramixta manurensis]|uniref:Hcp1 family type VI secretion system effector n=1 Tax=Paramixta manurensis TaxID=2740817 RepID=A0A6M8UC17_9GAMM|nr:hypothetical protein PMPD1_2148 [Erwiniaceae bacterium PD-1]